MESSALVLVGAVDWVHPAWRGQFYPEGLPDDWLLSYYNTQFEAVYLAAERWRDVSPATWAQWLADTQDGFHFILETAARAPYVPASGRVVVADAAWEAKHVSWLDAQPDLRALAARITQHAARAEPLFVFSRSGDLARLEQVKSLKEVLGY
ncbi:hypothetical protein Tbd_1901 [Thiobacillus denitrificans ATCC 25259]|uniref:DUF72 domain-containing protein n=1 Tax=Thiobacillus denitrificans (strain ATCC 25259 / T1) TaxID=292415 RepID=Q3SHN2_THIDA|nr:DUF72 domain-containing protein [Thiobacillus denitrificans]AAZ97854.1 hypothetical protein Tbd_1901 [Thiobacillus denitrificans ATCC 25259]